MKKFIKENRFYILFFVAFTIIACFFPPMGDDYMWGTSDGLKLLNNRFVDYNGRYLGNIFAIVLTRVPYLLPIIKSFTLTSILYLVYKITGNKNKDLPYISAMILVCPSLMLTQGIIWTAGFVNYCLSALIIMVCLYIIFFIQNKKIWHYFVLAIFGVAGQLFMETYTLFTLLMAVGAVVYFANKNKKPDWASIVYLVSCISGAVIMFTNSVYMKVLTVGTKYQNIEGKDDSIIKTLINQADNLFGKVFANMLMGCFPALIVLLIICFIKMKKSGKKSKLVVSSLFGTLALFILFAVRIVVGLMKYGKAMYVKSDMGALAATIFLAGAIMVGAFFDKSQKRKVLLYFIMLMSTSVPFCFIGPVGARCFMIAYILLIMMINTLYDFKETRVMSIITRVASCILFAVLLVCYISVYSDYRQKVEDTKTQMAEGKTVIQLQHTKLKKMVHAPDEEEMYEVDRRRFCEYHDFPDYLSFKY